MRRGAPLRQIKWKEIRRHNTIVDGWVVLRGKVYFLSPYLAYHPGGEKILKGVLGKDASKLFDKYHQWVNIEKYGIFPGRCLVHRFV
jgi:cytochrome b involved in lipid metabolism